VSGDRIGNQLSDVVPERRDDHHRILRITLAISIVVFVIGLFFSLGGSPAEGLVQQGRVSLGQGNFAAAITYAERAVVLAPMRPSGWKLLVESASQNGQLDQACNALEEFARHLPVEAGHVAIRVGQEWMTQNKIRHAVRAFRLCETLKVDVQKSLRLQERIASVSGHPRETSRCVVDLLRHELFPTEGQSPKTPHSQFVGTPKSANFMKEDLLLVSSLFPFSIEPERLEAILESDPTNRSPLLARAIVPAHTNQVDLAEKLLLEITQSRPDDLEALGTLAELYAQYRPEKFIAWHSQLPKMAQDDAVIWSARGKWLSQAGKIESSVRCLHEALLREPELITATALLGQLLKSINETEIGIAFSERNRLLQRVLDLNGRLKESRGEEFVLPMVETLEASGRLWEAWGWCALYKRDVGMANSEINVHKVRLESRLKPDDPRTVSGSLPGEDFAWERFPLPDWSKLESNLILRPDSKSNSDTTIRFADQGEQAGLNFRFISTYNIEHGRRIYESMGAGVAVIDYDMDSWPDLYFPQGRPMPLEGSDGPSDAIYRNLSGGKFLEVSTLAGIRETTYSHGVAAGDYDNDGFPDVYVANLGRNRLYRNNGDGTFSDVTDSAGFQQNLWTVSCAIADLNGDGMPELFDVNYLQGKELLTKVCRDANNRPTVCRPTNFEPSLDTVAMNLGDGRFREQQSESGLNLPRGMGLGLVIADFNDDRRLDVFVANDMTPNYLLINEKTASDQPLQFVDQALLRGIAFDYDGLAQACMGVACADINRDGQLDLLVTNFFAESNTLYLSQPGGFYQDQTLRAGLREPSVDMLGFGAQFFDADRDGYPDLVVMNGHVDRHMDDPYQMRAQVFRGLPDARFVELFAAEAGPLFDKPRLGRGLATFDWNRDGRTDFVATDLEDNVLLGVNQTESPYHSLRLRLVGTKSSRDAIGTVVKVRMSDNDERTAQLTAGNGYESSNERVIEIGTGSVEVIAHAEILWPSGTKSSGTMIATGVEWIVIEGRNDWIRRAVN
jgi:tetratricopeptide (TPR) repeat protein